MKNKNEIRQESAEATNPCIDSILLRPSQHGFAFLKLINIRFSFRALRGSFSSVSSVLST